MKTLWGKKEHSGKRHIALLLAVLVLMSTIPVFTYAEDIVGGEPGSGASSSGEAAPAEESKPEAEEPTESGPSGGESPSEERRRDRDDKGSTDEYSLTVTQEELFTEDGLAVEITAVSTFPFTRNLHIEAKDGGKAEGATEGDEKVTGDPEASLSEASSSEMSSEASSDTSSETSPAESSVPEDPASSEEAGSDVSSVPEEPASSEESKPEGAPESGQPEENSKPDEESSSESPKEETTASTMSGLAEAAAMARINLVRVLSAEITADELTESSKPADDPAANTSTEEEKAPAPAESSSAPAVSGGEDMSSDVSSDTGSDASQDNSTDSSSEPSSSDSSSSDASSSDASSPEVSSTDETMSEGKVTVNEEGELFRFQRKFTVTKNGTYVVRIYDDEGPLEERAFYTEVEVTSLGELTAEIVPGSYGQYEVEMASTYPETDRFVVEYIPAAQAMYRSRSAEPIENEPVEVPVEDVTVKTVDDGEEDKDEENAPSEVTEASTAVPMSADGVYTVKAFRGENLLTTMSLMAGEIELHSLAAVYWNPDPETKSNADGTSFVPGGDDDNPGTAYAPVRSFEQALELVAPSGTIYCMNPAAESADYLKRNSQMTPENIVFSGVFEGFAQLPVRVARHTNHPSGAIFTLGEGISMTLSKIEIAGENAQTDELIRLAGGTLKIGDGLRLPNGQIFFEHPDTAQAVELLALPQDTLVLSFVAGENSFKASFDTVRAVGGVSMQEALAKLALTESLKNTTPAWSLVVRADEANVVQARPAVVYSGSIYLSGTGNDANTGATAADPVRTFARAKELLANELNGRGSIYICGDVPVEGDEVWSDAIICGYGGEVKVSGSLTLDGITMDGGSPSYNGDISVSGGSLTVTGGSALSGTKSSGSSEIFKYPMIYISKGSAVLQGGSTISGTDIGVEIARDGTFTLESGTISGVTRGVEVGENGRFEMKGGSISAERTGVDTLGEFVLSGGSVSASDDNGFAVSVNRPIYATNAAFSLDGSAAELSGKIRLETPEEKITLTGAPGTGKTFAVELGDSHHPGNVIVAPGGSLTSAETYADAFTLSGTVYKLAGYQKNLVLMGGVYLDGTAASNGTGLSPASPVRTFAAAKGILDNNSDLPAKVILCGPVTVGNGITEVWQASPDKVIEVTRWDNADRPIDRFVTVAGGRLTLENVVLDGRFGEANTSVDTIVSVEATGWLTLNEGAVIRGSAGSGVTANGGIVYLMGGEISGNKGRGVDSTNGGVMINSGKITGNGRNGVYLDGGTINMSGGEISGNYTALEETEKYETHRGGGVWIAGGEFTMSGGEISGNLCDISENRGEALGGGVYFAGSKMTVNGDARISGNTATKGGGVYFAGTTGMEMGGTASISGNHVNEAILTEESRLEDGALGGGVYVEAGDLTIKDSVTITNNEAVSNQGRQTPAGGGVYIAPGLSMLEIKENVTISGNTAQRGAGVAHEGQFFNLGGTGVTIDDEIFIDMNQETIAKKGPIDLTGPLGTDKTFRLRVPDTYIGKTVVTGDTGYDAADYLEQGVFTQVEMGGGLTLAGERPDIVGRGGLYVYLSGTGNDNYDGTSPDDAVKTFARARALLQSRPKGTNILISGTVTIRNNETWSLPEMTNNSGEMWRPEIRTMADGVYTFAPVFVSKENNSGVVVGPDAKLTLEDIIINGNGVQIAATTALGRYGASLVQVSGAGELVLGEGAIIENSMGPGVAVGRGTCSIDGAVIRNNEGPGVCAPANLTTITMNSGSVTGNRTGGFIIEGGPQTFIMNGGTISGNTHGESGLANDPASGIGGGVCILATKSSFEMNGGEISGNEAAGNGGGVYLSADVNCVIKGKIIENRAGGSGGGVGNGSTLGGVELGEGAEISRNSAGASGGGIHTGDIIMRGGAISDNTASTYGGGINIMGGMLSGGTVSGNTAAGGGGIYLRAGTVTLDGVSITGNHAIGTTNSVGGGAIATILSSNITIRSGKISGNTSAGNGGAIVLGMLGNTVTIEGGEISGNEAAGDGGAIYLHTCRNGFTMSGGNISGNTAGGSGGGIAGDSGAVIKCTYNGGSITGNTAAENGGGINLAAGEAEFKGVTVSDNTARAGGGVRVAEKGSLTINAGSITGNRTTSAGVTGGAGVCLDGGTVTAAGGQISGNALGSSTQKGAGVYVAGGNFVLRGGRTVIDDPIYLNTTASPVRVSAAITQNRKYHLTMNMGSGASQYKSGSAVVRPLSGSGVSDASAYLRYFQSDAEGLLLDKASPDIVLRKIVFLDGENGGTSDWYDGSTPTKAFKTFELAKAALDGAPGAIYVTGTVTVDKPTAWSLENGQYLRRYNGFEVAGQKSYDAFAGDLVCVADGGSLTLTNIPIEGRRSAEDSYTASGTLVRVANGGTLTMNAGAALRNNKTSGDGGAVIVEEGGTFLFSGGEISNSQAARGDAVYQGGTMEVKGNASAKGSVYLAAGKTVDAVTAFTGTLTVDMADPAMGREVVVYPNQLGSGSAAELAKFTLAEAVAAQYRLVHGTVDSHSVLKLGEKGFVYVDGTRASDGDGTTPDTAFATLRAAYSSSLQREGGTIYIVKPVTITESIKIAADSYEDRAGKITLTGGPVAVKRYSKPTKASQLTGYGKASNTEELFIVENGGSLQLTGTTIDGHSEAVTQGREALIAPAVEAEAPLVTVQSGGTFHTSGTILRNNRNASTNGQGGAVYIAEGGKYQLYSDTVIANTHAEEGSAVYQTGQLMISSAVGTDEELSVEGEVFLGTEKYIETFNAFAPVGALKIDLGDAYNGRTLVTYDAQNPDTIVVDPTKVALSDRVAAGFVAGKRDGENVLELQTKGAVYINGVSGSDEADGTTPATAVKTLAKAYEKLAAQKGGTLYVVGEITIGKDQNITLSGQELFGAGYVDAGGPVTIKRYSQPTAHATLDGYEVGGNTGSLFVVEGGGSLTLENITVDGHRYAVTGDEKIAAPGTGGEAIVTVNEGKLILNEGTVLQNNVAALLGGAIATPLADANGPIEIEINGGKITGNKGATGSGAIFVGIGASLRMTDGEISGNEGSTEQDQDMVGGIYSFGAQVEITGGSIRDNVGMGFVLRSGNASLKNCVITGNKALRYAGGIVNNGGVLTAENLTLSGNTCEDGVNGIYQNGTLRLRGRATSFGADQYVYLLKGKVINVEGALPDSIEIPVDMDRADTDDAYGPGRNVVVYMDGLVEDVAAEAVKFPLVDDIGYPLVKSSTEANTLELGSPFQFMDLEKDFLKQAGVPVTITAEVSSAQVESCELYCGTDKIDTTFNGVVNSSSEGKSYVSVTYTPQFDWEGQGNGSYHLQATDSNGTTVKSKNFTVSLWRVAYSDNGTAMETSTLGADATGPNDTATLEVKAYQPLATTGHNYDPNYSMTINGHTLKGGDDSFAPQLVEKDAVVNARTVWGSDDAMKNFAIEGPDNEESIPYGPSRAYYWKVSVPYSLYNANAISEEKDGSMTMQVTLRRGAVEYAADTAEIKLHTNPARIDATVPLWVCMYGYGGDGKVVTPEEGSYTIKNNSSFPVAVTEMSVHPADGWHLVQAPDGGFVTNGKYDISKNTLVEGQAALRLDTHWISSGVNGADWSMSAGDASTGPLFQPIGAGEARSIPVECYIPAGGVAGEGETLLATVTYTVGVSGSAANGG